MRFMLGLTILLLLGSGALQCAHLSLEHLNPVGACGSTVGCSANAIDTDGSSPDSPDDDAPTSSDHCLVCITLMASAQLTPVITLPAMIEPVASVSCDAARGPIDSRGRCEAAPRAPPFTHI